MDIMDPRCIRRPIPLSSNKNISSGGGGFNDLWGLGLPYETMNLDFLNYIPAAFAAMAITADNCHCPTQGQSNSNSNCVCSLESKPANEKPPIWKRRGASPIQPLKLDPLIRCEGWLENYHMMEPLMEMVRHQEWVAKGNYFEAHSKEDIDEGVVINAPAFPAWYTVQSSGLVVPAQLPYCTEILIDRALRCGYDLQTLTTKMGFVVADYSTVLIHPKRRDTQEILILAGKEWQGTAAIFAGVQLKTSQINVSLYIHDSTKVKTIEESAFAAAGGKIYRNLEDLKGLKFRVIVVALESQHSGRSSILPLFGELLQHSVAVFVDPPVLKGSYCNALQYACNGAYNISQKTVIFTPALPKSYVVDDFVDIFVVDVGIIPETYTSCGMDPFSFRQRMIGNSKVQLVVPQKFTPKGNKIQFYTNGQPVV